MLFERSVSRRVRSAGFPIRTKTPRDYDTIAEKVWATYYPLLGFAVQLGTLIVWYAGRAAGYHRRDVSGYVDGVFTAIWRCFTGRYGI